MSELILTECACCRGNIEQSDTTETSDGLICLYCIDTNYVECNDCSEYIHTDDITVVAGNDICEDCISSSYHQCDWCGEWENRRHLRWLGRNGNEVCESCWDNHVQYCNECDQPYHQDDMNGYYCLDCAEERRYDDYNYSSDFIYHKTMREPRYNGNLLYFGIELEVGSESTSDFHSLLGDYTPQIVMLTDDCSIYDDDIPYGVELVSHPATYNWLNENRFIWSDILRTFRQNHIQSFTTSTCGIHIHLSKNCFTHSHLYNFLKMIYAYPKFTKFISQRGKMGYRWCSLENEAGSEQIAEKADKKSSWEKYTAANLVHPHTVEVRIFRGNLKECSFYKNIQYLHSLFMFTKDFSRNNTDLTIDNYLRYVAINKNQYIDLYKWLKEKGKFNVKT
jgi:hypothetical protein